MTRVTSERGPWRTTTLTLRELDLADVDVAAGGRENRARWLREVVLAALGQGEEATEPAESPPVKAAPERPARKPRAPRKGKAAPPEVTATEGSLALAPVVPQAEVVAGLREAIAAVEAGGPVVEPAGYGCCKHCKHPHGRLHPEPCANGCG